MFPMKHLTTSSLSILIAASAFAQSAPAKSAWSQTSNIALSTDYVFRGVSQIASSSAVAFSGGSDISHSSGLSLGAWFANQNFNSNDDNDTLEADLYGAYTFKISSADISVGVVTYNYPGASKYNTVEGNLGVALAGASLKYSHSFTDYFGVDGSDSTGYVDLSYSYTASDLTLALHYGWTLGAGAQDDYEDYKISLAYPVAGYTATVAYTDANLGAAAVYNGKQLDDAAVVFSLSKTF